MNDSATEARFPRYLNNLTALRYPAALYVVLLHVTPHFMPVGKLYAVTRFGYVGVSFFFLLSGFVLTWSGVPRSRASFWWRRASRIVPLSIVFTLVAFTIMARSQLIPDAWGILQNFVLIQAWNPKSTVFFGGNGVMWSLSCELFFYLMFPFIIGPVSRLDRRGLAITAAATFAFLAIPPYVAAQEHMNTNVQYWMFYVFPPYRFGEFVMGMLLARAVRLGFGSVSWTKLVGLGAPAAAAMAVLFLIAHQTPSAPFISLFLLPAFSAVLVVAALHHRRRDARQSPRILVKLGEWSFAMYVIHQLLFRATLKNAFGDQGLTGPLGLIAYIVVATALAGLCCSLIERPCLRLLADRRILQRIGVGKARAAA